MSLSAKQNTESLVIDRWIRSGKPVLTQLKKHNTLALLFGTPTTAMVSDAYGKPMPKVTFEGLEKLSMEDSRYLVFPYAQNVDAGNNIQRGAAGLATRTAVTTDPFDALKFQTSWYVINYDISNDKLDELKGTKFALNGTFASNVANAIMRNYLDKTATALFATGSNKMPSDGVLGSLRAQISDGLGSGGSHNDETPYASFLGFTRDSTHTDFSAPYAWSSGDLTVKNLETYADLAYQNGASNLVFPMNPTRFRIFEDLIRSTYGTNSLALDSDMMGLGIGAGSQLRIGGFTCYVDYDVPVGTWQIGFDLPSVAAGSDFAKVTTNIIPNPSVYNGSLLQGRFRHQVCVPDPRKCVLIDNLTSR